MERFPVCVIGVGPAGACYLKEIKRDWRIQVVGLVNRSPERRQAVSAETGVPGFATLEELLAAVPVRPRLAVISTANATHKDFAIACLKAGLDVFCEKPMAMTLDDCQAMLAEEKTSGRSLQIAFEYRYGSVTRRLHELIRQGFFGELTCLDVVDSRGHWWPESPDTPLSGVKRLNADQDGGPVIHCGVHLLDLMRAYVGEVASVQAFVPRRSIAFYPSNMPDHVNLQLRFASGASGSLTIYHNLGGTWYRAVPPFNPNYHAVPGHRMDLALTGTGGSALAEIYSDCLHLNVFDVPARETRYLRTERFDHQHPNVSHHNTGAMIVEFALRCRDGLGPLHSAADSLRTTALTLACEAAVQAAIADGWTSGLHRLG